MARRNDRRRRVTRRDRGGLRPGGSADVARDRATGMEMATGRGVRRPGHVAAENDAGALALRVGHRGGGQQRLRVWMVRRVEQRGCLRDFHQPAEIHDRDPVRDVPHHGEVVRYEHIGQAETLLQILHQVDHLRLDRNVQRGDRLVRDDQPRPHGQRAGDGDALPLAAGELEWEAAQMDRVEPDEAQQFDHAVAPGGMRKSWFMHIERFGDDILDPVARAERGIGILEHDLQCAAALAQGARRSAWSGRCRRNERSPEVGSVRRRIMRPVVDLPQPDSPTRARVSPRGDIERNAIDGLDLTRGTGIEDAAGNGKMLCQFANRQQRFAS